MTKRQDTILSRTPTVGNVHEVATAAVAALDVHPDFLVWNYVRAAIVKHGTISEAARALSMHRRTLQRVISKNCPPPRPILVNHEA